MDGADRLHLVRRLAEQGIKGVTVLTVDASRSAKFITKAIERLDAIRLFQYI